MDHWPGVGRIALRFLCDELLLVQRMPRWRYAIITAIEDDFFVSGASAPQDTLVVRSKMSFC